METIKYLIKKVAVNVIISKTLMSTKVIVKGLYFPENLAPLKIVPINKNRGMYHLMFGTGQRAQEVVKMYLSSTEVQCLLCDSLDR